MAVNYEKILKDCIWEYNFTIEDIKKLAIGTTREKSFLFQKILLNSTSLFSSLKIFNENDLKILIEQYKVPTFNHDYTFKRKNMAEVYFLNKPLAISELQWVA
jgi:hypothetical protein